MANLKDVEDVSLQALKEIELGDKMPREEAIALAKKLKLPYDDKLIETVMEEKAILDGALKVTDRMLALASVMNMIKRDGFDTVVGKLEKLKKDKEREDAVKKRFKMQMEEGF